jgi:lipopolysaccharide export system protein LptC
VENLVATAFDSQGHPRYTLSAARMVHYTDDDTTTLEVPRFEQQAPGAPAIRAAARRGLVSSNGDHVHLLDAVSMTRAAHQGMPELVLTTDYLHVTPEAESMRTDKPVRLRQGTSWLAAESLYFDAKARILDLKGGVKGSYEIQH